MAFDKNIGGHAFPERGGTCVKCGMYYNNYEDKDSKDYLRPCTGRKLEKRERTEIPD
jgi:hypothetical protein